MVVVAEEARMSVVGCATCASIVVQAYTAEIDCGPTWPTRGTVAPRVMSRAAVAVPGAFPAPNTVEQQC